ncbi:MAG: methionyl-tRNA formyltransferase, partial [Burkholderiaceae bacterium]
MESLPITAGDTTGSLHDKLAELGGKLIVEAIGHLAQGHALPAMPQPQIGITYAAKITKEEAALDFSQSALALACKIRAFSPFPGAVGNFNGMPLKIWRADAEMPAAFSRSQPGAVLSADAQSGIAVQCGDGVLRLLELQKPGGKRLPASEFLKGFPMEGGRFA